MGRPIKILPTGEGSKACPDCGEDKPLHDYYFTYWGKPRPQCKPCYIKRTAVHRFSRLYGFTGPEGRDELLAEQGGVCAICGGTEVTAEGWHTDHCHSSGKVRGILCGHCNRALGGFRDSIPILESAIAYVERHHAAG